MSADNRLCYMYVGLPYDQWVAWNGSGSCDYHEPPPNSHWFLSEAEMWEWLRAEEERISYLEYGVQRIGIDEQRVALTDAIADLQCRLHRLNETSQQWQNPDSESI